MLDNTVDLLSDTMTNSIMYTSHASAREISCGYGNPGFTSIPQTNRSTSLLCHHEDSELIQSLITKINDLTEQCNSLAYQVSNLTQPIKSTNSMETQTITDINVLNLNTRLKQTVATQTEPEPKPSEIIKQSVENHTQTNTATASYSQILKKNLN
ncbi:unnamed protein product [Mytilus coruscus]|uniref:Uncharacterized protein n=1 Tax=Mytilus coruscus TaxID=42192 RepID=A0A6J8E973_MYTCO|nr:unnamed protein product [Mytilus coruscus]